MTALDKAIIKAYRKPSPQGEAVAGPVVASTRVTRPAVPLSKALAELGHLPAKIAPVGPAIADLLAGAAHVAVGATHLTVDAVEEVGSVARAVVDPSSATGPNASPRVAATASAVRAALPVVLAATAPGAVPIVVGSLAAIQAVCPAIHAAQTAAESAKTVPEPQSTSELFESPGLGSMLKKKSTASPASAVKETPPARQSIAAKIMNPAIAVAEEDEDALQTEAVHVLPAPPEIDSASAEAASAESPTVENSLPQWHPMLQVDRLVWPSACSRLQGMAAEALDQMVDGLRKIQNAGKKVIGMASCGDGEGVSTLLLAAARRMSHQGLSVAVVDANLTRPTLATAVGLLPQIGWEKALSGDVPLEDVVIESESDHVAILPIIHAPAEISAEAVESHLATLAQNFDSVLVDLGSLFTGDGQWNEVASVIATTIGGMVLVQNVRKTTPNRLTEAQSHLEQSGVPLVGMIQNFVVA